MALVIAMVGVGIGFLLAVLEEKNSNQLETIGSYKDAMGRQHTKIRHLERRLKEGR